MCIDFLNYIRIFLYKKEHRTKYDIPIDINSFEQNMPQLDNNSALIFTPKNNFISTVPVFSRLFNFEVKSY